MRRGEGFVGWGRVASITTAGPDRFTAAETWWQDLVRTAQVHDEVGVAGTGPIALGSFAYSAASAQGASLTVPQVVVGRRGDQAGDDDGCRVRPECHQREPSRQPLDVRFADGARSSEWATVVNRRSAASSTAPSTGRPRP